MRFLKVGSGVAEEQIGVRFLLKVDFLALQKFLGATQIGMRAKK
ncbi:hypothetical protein B1R32_10534 [Abditibacterium utsteinense]|uniref:Uncharacterized protein n=1 Tax=Abditibacterium utsteinense TaxID=1960156 RepID=A0A2S8SU74_9BACT|nr:hypothetical protein B1R32_10534 [Abditibacterium utsteinense]